MLLEYKNREIVDQGRTWEIPPLSIDADGKCLLGMQLLDIYDS
jgi:hypothetical protein